MLDLVEVLVVKSGVLALATLLVIRLVCLEFNNLRCDLRRKGKRRW
jgi:hypothetical protein